MEANKSGKWTILIYANGNNEYEPEMFRSMLAAEKASSFEEVNVVMEIGREDISIARLLRPWASFAPEVDSWTGVRRYLLSSSGSRLIEDIGRINMVDPRHLRDFIKWGMENYPAEHFVLIIGGHGAAFVGALTDFSQELPYIMETADMCRAINMAALDTGKKIDLVVLDICFMNFLDVMYEFGRHERCTVERVITYIGGGPLEGMPYDTIIDIIGKEPDKSDSALIAKNIVQSLNLNLTAVEINKERLGKLKDLVNLLAFTYLSRKDATAKSPEDIIYGSDSSSPWYGIAEEIHSTLQSIILCCKSASGQEKRPLEVTTINPRGMLAVYCKLGFAQNNYWTQLIAQRGLGEGLEVKVREEFKPSVMTRRGLLALIFSMNPGCELGNADNMLKQLVEYKNWNWR